MKEPKEGSVTGRDTYIMAQALYQACKYQQSLKDAGDTRYEWSNHQDMKAILVQRFDGWGELFALSDKQQGHTPADLIDEKDSTAARKEA